MNLAKEYGLDDLQFIETSAKTGINVKQLFKNLATHLPGIQSTSATSSGFAGSKPILGEGGQEVKNEKFKLSAESGRNSQQ